LKRSAHGSGSGVFNPGRNSRGHRRSLHHGLCILKFAVNREKLATGFGEIRIGLMQLIDLGQDEKA
jgi:hypothetical protein